MMKTARRGRSVPADGLAENKYSRSIHQADKLAFCEILDSRYLQTIALNRNAWCYILIFYPAVHETSAVEFKAKSESERLSSRLKVRDFLIKHKISAYF
ncbi:hypothetical protein L596_003733 [Steinernema carpocapsae]|uniref:Uncharacterized protein n=1 Tax=Steinernema carpocapsae TaxID=34508 RepID=A0A4U8UUK1_STECR|nr:hypothetical protein L596_003733 [Steinernema carpocapsae]